MTRSSTRGCTAARRFPNARGHPECERSSTHREVEVTVNNLPGRLHGKRVTVYANRKKVGTMRVNNSGHASREWSTEHGQFVPRGRGPAEPQMPTRRTSRQPPLIKDGGVSQKEQMPAPRDNHPDARPPGRPQTASQLSNPGQPASPASGHAALPHPCPAPTLMIKEHLLCARLAYKRLTRLSFPRRFPIVQFPNLPLIIAFLAGQAGKLLEDSSAHPYAASVSYLAMTIWAYEELAHGVNWFRRLLGLTFVILLTIRVAHAIHP